MSKSEEKAKQQEEKVETVDTETPQQEAPQEEKELSVEEQLAVAKEQIEQEKKEYMFLLAEFDNFRKRTIKEKADIIKNASEKAMTDLLPVIDDMERAMQAIEASDNIDSAKEGINLIYNKFIKYLEQNGVKAIDSTNADFNTEYHEAVTIFPAPDEDKKGKVIDTVQKGYTMNDKVIRHSKVVVGQ
ncbi:MAG: nucleotide exchange factor GrpE [Muribaculaceae bacterium]|nr:nucleotide exchange factor GrpE [Muribaculaceae bacterium]MDD6868376.1 nucleotide exchange factor GrpE [bacterium]